MAISKESSKYNNFLEIIELRTCLLAECMQHDHSSGRASFEIANLLVNVLASMLANGLSKIKASTLC